MPTVFGFRSGRGVVAVRRSGCIRRRNPMSGLFDGAPCSQSPASRRPSVSPSTPTTHVRASVSLCYSCSTDSPSVGSWPLTRLPAKSTIVRALLTVEEERARAAGDAAGTWFRVGEASRVISKAIAASSCQNVGAIKGSGSLQVWFTKQGKAERVELLSGPYKGTETGRCLERALLQVRVAPWQRGEGVAPARFHW